MQRRALTSPAIITLVLILQFVPLVLFPASSFSPSSQEWWLPILLAIMVLVADFQIIVRRSVSLGPWYLMAFAQGFNIISRLMMLWVHATVSVGKANVPNWPYILLTFIAMGLSLVIVRYSEMPEVRVAYLPK